MIVTRVGVLSVAKVLGILYGGLGFFAGLVFACIALLGVGFASALQHDAQVPAFVPALFGVGAVIVLPIVYGLMGFIVGGLSAWLFNVAAGITGGVEIHTEP